MRGRVSRRKFITVLGGAPFAGSLTARAATSEESDFCSPSRVRSMASALPPGLVSYGAQCGTNVVPAELEAILAQHPGVRDGAVVGLKDDDLGRHVHAPIEPANADAPPAVAELDAHLRLHLTSYKLPRDDARKIRRTKLRDDRRG